MELQQNDFSLTPSSGRLITLNLVVTNNPDSHEKDVEAPHDELEPSTTPIEAASAAAAVAAENAAGNVSGVRKMLLNPAEEAFDSARQTAELIIKDTINALQRTKQRLIDILPHRRVPSSPNGTTTTGTATQAAADLKKAVEDVAQQSLGKSRTDSPSNGEQDENAEEGSSTSPASVVSQPAMGFVDSLKRAPASVLARTGEIHTFKTVGGRELFTLLFKEKYVVGEFIAYELTSHWWVGVYTQYARSGEQSFTLYRQYDEEVRSLMMHFV